MQHRDVRPGDKTSPNVLVCFESDDFGHFPKCFQKTIWKTICEIFLKIIDGQILMPYR